MACFRRLYVEFKKMLPPGKNVADEAMADQATVPVIWEAFDFLEAEDGLVQLMGEEKFAGRKSYWKMLMNSFCYANHDHDDRTKEVLLSKARVNLALQTLPKLPDVFECPENSTLRKGKCNG